MNFPSNFRGSRVLGEALFEGLDGVRGLEELQPQQPSARHGRSLAARLLHTLDLHHVAAAALRVRTGVVAYTTAKCALVLRFEFLNKKTRASFISLSRVVFPKVSDVVERSIRLGRESLRRRRESVGALEIVFEKPFFPSLRRRKVKQSWTPAYSQGAARKAASTSRARRERAERGTCSSHTRSSQTTDRISLTAAASPSSRRGADSDASRARFESSRRSSRAETYTPTTRTVPRMCISFSPRV